MKIKELVDEAIGNGEKIEMKTEAGKEGVLMVDRGEFIPFDELGFSSELGFFSLVDFPFMDNDAE